MIIGEVRTLPTVSFPRRAERGIYVPHWAFKPDSWSTAFIHGLEKLASRWESGRIWEVGVGTGANIIALHDKAPQACWYFSDYDSRCVPLALRNFRNAFLDGRTLKPLIGSWDLVHAPSGRQTPRVDVIFGCLPQVPALHRRDSLAHYYDPERYAGRWHEYGLALNEALLVRARDVLESKGEVVLNLSGRPGKTCLLDMFRACGYSPRIVHTEVIAQHPGTSLASLASLEEGGAGTFEFFGDEEGTEPIPATEAEARRRANELVFHKIYVVHGVLE